MSLVRLVLALAIVFAPLCAHAQRVGEAEHRQLRSIPDFGRAPEPEEPVEALLWIPRIVFFPVHLVLEYLVRRPLAWVLRTIELERLDELFRRDGMPQLASQEQALWSLLPHVRYDFRLQPSVGLVLQLRDSTERFRGKLGFSFWSDEQIAGDFELRVRFGDASLVLATDASHRSDGLFQGLGWKASPSRRARYAETRAGGALVVHVHPWRRSAFSAGLRTDARHFGETEFRQDDEISLDEAIARGELAPPPAYPEGYTALETWLRLVLDTREESDWPHASGIRAEVLGAWAIDLERGIDSNWLSAHLDVELALSLMRDRTLSLRSLVALAEPLGSVDIPFTEQIWLGTRLSWMPGFVPGALIGESAATVGLAWRYTVWAWLDAAVFVDVGNVFAAHFSDFEFERLRLSFGTTLMGYPPDGFTLLVAFGTDPFVQGASITSFRFAIGIGELVMPGAGPAR